MGNQLKNLKVKHMLLTSKVKNAIKNKKGALKKKLKNEGMLLSFESYTNHHNYSEFSAHP